MGSLRPLGSERLWVLVLLAPTLLGLVLGTFGANFTTLGLSVFDRDLLTPPEFVRAQNYIDLPDSRMFGKALWNTVPFSALYVPLVMILSVAVALVLNRGVIGQALFRELYFLPVVSSLTAVGLLWIWICSEDDGALNAILGVVGVEPVTWLGAKMVLATIHAFQAFDHIYILTRVGNGNSSFPTLVFPIYRFFRMGDAAAQAVGLTGITLAFTWVYFRMQKRWGAT